MNGRKLVGIVIAVVIIGCLFSIITITNFYKNNEKQPNIENWEKNKENSLNFIFPQITITSNFK